MQAISRFCSLLLISCAFGRPVLATGDPVTDSAQGLPSPAAVKVETAPTAGPSSAPGTAAGNLPKHVRAKSHRDKARITQAKSVSGKDLPAARDKPATVDPAEPAGAAAPAPSAAPADHLALESSRAVSAHVVPARLGHGKADETAAGPPPAELAQQARSLEQAGRTSEALQLYRRAGQQGYGPASKRAGELYLSREGGGQHRDYAEAVKWFALARDQGMQIPAIEKR